MASRIPQHFIDELLARVDITEIIAARVPLAKYGKEYRACCPFHAENTPSFYVSPQKQFYHCFGCGAHGTAIGFLMAYERLDFLESVETLAQQFGLVIPWEGGTPPRDPSTIADNTQIYAVLAQAAQFFEQQLRASDTAKQYLIDRGLTGQTAKHFGLGYAPPGWDSLIKHCQTTFDEDSLVGAGLAIRKDNGGCYDRFRDRIMFPIRDHRGRVIGFGGRIIGSGEPKYLNSPQTPVFHKGQALYGLYEARQHHRELDRIFIVEGYMDVIGLAQAGIPNTVATLGTATTSEHIDYLMRTTPHLTFCFDGDNAGRKAAWRALDTSLPALRDDRLIDFMFLPEGEDPDSYVRQVGAAGFIEQAQQAISFTDHFMQTLRGQHKTTTLEGRSQFATAAKRYLQTIRPGLLRTQLIATVAQETDLRPEAIERQLGQTSPAAQALTPDRYQVRVTPMRQAIAALLARPELGLSVSDVTVLRNAKIAGAQILCELLETVHANPQLTAAGLWERVRDSEHSPHLLKLMQSISFPEEPNALDQVFQDAIQRIRDAIVGQRIDELLDRDSKRSLTEEERNELRGLLRARHVTP